MKIVELVLTIIEKLRIAYRIQMKDSSTDMHRQFCLGKLAALDELRATFTSFLRDHGKRTTDQ